MKSPSKCLTSYRGIKLVINTVRMKRNIQSHIKLYKKQTIFKIK